MKRRPMVLRVSAVCLSVALAGAYITYRVTNARRAAAPGPAPASTGPSLAQPPRHFGGTKRAEVFEVGPAERGEFFVGTKSGAVVTPGDLEKEPRVEPAEEQEPKFDQPPIPR